MQYTVAAVFERQFQARDAFNELLNSGFRLDELRLVPEGSLDSAQPSAPYENGEEEDRLVSRAASTIEDVFDDEDDEEIAYPETEPGHYVLTVHVSDDGLVDKATELLDKYDPVDTQESTISNPVVPGAVSFTAETL